MRKLAIFIGMVSLIFSLNGITQDQDVKKIEPKIEILNQQLETSTHPVSGQENSELSIFQEKPFEADSSQLKELNQLKKVIKNDLLSEELEKKKILFLEKENQKQKKEEQKAFYLKEDDFWSFASRYWMVLRRTELYWDFDHPDYGLEFAVIELFKKLFIYQQKIQLVYVKTGRISYIYLPANKGETLILLSIPFMRSLDLSKMEIAILVLETYLRSEMKDFSKYVEHQDLKAQLGKNYFQKKIDWNPLKKMMDQYDHFVYHKGFQFKQQFEVTKKMVSILKSHPKLLQLYKGVLQKIDTLIKTQPLYKFHAQIYPSPEFQLKWIEQ